MSGSDFRASARSVERPGRDEKSTRKRSGRLPPRYADLTLRTPRFFLFSGVRFSQIIQRSIMIIIWLNLAGLCPIG